LTYRPRTRTDSRTLDIALSHSRNAASSLQHLAEYYQRARNSTRAEQLLASSSYCTRSPAPALQLRGRQPSHTEHTEHDNDDDNEASAASRLSRLLSRWKAGNASEGSVLL